MSECDEIEEAIKAREVHMLELERDYEDAAGDPGLRNDIGKQIERWAQYLEDAYYELAGCRDGLGSDGTGPF